MAGRTYDAAKLVYDMDKERKDRQINELRKLFDFDAPEEEVMLVTHGVITFLQTLPAEAEAGGRRFVRSNSMDKLLQGGRASSNIRERMEQAAGRPLPAVYSLNVRPGWKPIKIRQTLAKPKIKATAVIGVRVKQEVLEELAAEEGDEEGASGVDEISEADDSSLPPPSNKTHRKRHVEEDVLTLKQAAHELSLIHI